MGIEWSYLEAKEHFFIEPQRIGADDLLSALVMPTARDPEIARLAETLLQNLRSTRHAASIPFYTTLVGASGGRAGTIEEMSRGATSRDELIRALVKPLNDLGATIRHCFKQLHTLHEKRLFADAFQALLRQLQR